MVVAVVPVRTQLRAFLYTAVFCTAPLAAPADPIEYVDTAKLSERELLVAAVRAGAQLPTAALEQKLTGAASPQDRREKLVQMILEDSGTREHFRCCDVERWRASQLSAAAFAKLESERQPLLIRGGVDHWAAVNWTMQSMVRLFGDRTIKFSQKTSGDLNGQAYNGPISSFNQALSISTHFKSIYCLDEDMTYKNEQMISALGEVLLGPDGEKVPMTSTNGFRWFPPELRFNDRAILLGGYGARTSLHADMANWTGWNALFAGTKLWRFFPPTAPIPRVTRQGKLGNITADFKSAVDTFHRVQFVGMSDSVPSSSHRAQEKDLREELASLLLSQLRLRGRAVGLADEVLDGVLDEEDPKSVLVEMIVAQEETSYKSSTAGDAGIPGTQVLREELGMLSLSQMRKRGRAAGMQSQTLDELLDEEDPKAALVDALLRWELQSDDAHAMESHHSQAMDDETSPVEIAFTPDFSRFPEFEAAWEQRVEFIQQPGDVIIIPPGWWHQVYHRTKSTVGFASQYAGAESLPDVLSHIAEWQGCAVPPPPPSPLLWGSKPSADEVVAEKMQGILSCACAAAARSQRCDPRFLAPQKRRLDRSWLADGRELMWASPIRFREPRGAMKEHEGL